MATSSNASPAGPAAAELPTHTAPLNFRSHNAATVASRTLVATAAGVGFGALYGMRKGQPGLFAFRQGLNLFIFFMPFNTLSVYAIGPSLEYLAGKVYGDAYTNQPRNLRTENLATSSIAGALTGAGISAATRGAKSVLPGFATYGVVCLGFQYVVNELDIARIKFIARRAGGHHDAMPGLQTSLPAQTDAVSDAASSQRSSSALAGSEEATEPKAEKKSGVWSYLASVAPVRKVSDEEYAIRLAADLQAAEARLLKLKQEADEIEAQLGHASKKE